MRNTVGRMIKGRTVVSRPVATINPSTPSQLLDQTQLLYRQIGGSILRETFGASVFVYIGCTLLFQVLVPGFFTTEAPDSLTGQGVELLQWTALGTLVILPIALIGFAMIALSTTRHVWMRIQPALAERLKDPLQFFLPMVGVASYAGIVTVSPVIAVMLYLFGVALIDNELPDLNTAGPALLGFVAAPLAVVLAGYFLRNVSLVPSIIVVEGVGLKKALRRSFELVKPYRGVTGSIADFLTWLVFQVVLLALVIYFALGLVIGTFNVETWVRGTLGTTPVNELITVLIQGLPILLAVWVVAPYFGIALALCYAERRARLEGLDILLLKENLQK